MNFKGTANIPREQMKGIVERFGGMWNGYTWIDQTTYMETAGRAALDQMLFLEAERMANGLYDPAECESERTVIISELQGGENDPDQLLDTEVTATRVPGASVRASDDRMARRPQVDDARRPLRPLSAASTSRTTRRSSSWGTWMPTTCCGAPRSISAASRRARSPSAFASKSPRSLASGGSSSNVKARPAIVKMVFHAPAARDADFFPMLVLDAVLTGAKGVNLWSSFRGSPPQRKARLYTALVECGLASAVSGALLPTEQPFLYTLSFTAMEGRGARHASRPRCRPRSSACGPRASTPPRSRGRKRQLRARLVFENDSVTNVAHQLGYFETVTGPDYFWLAAAAHRRRHGRTGMGCRAAPACPGLAARSAGSARWSRANDADASRASLVARSRDARQRRGRHRPGDVGHSRRRDQCDVSGRQPLRARRPSGSRVPHRARDRSGHGASIG